MSKMGREAYDREHKCKTGVKDICEGETERVNEHGVRQCQPCATFIADQKVRTHLWDPHGLRVPWRFLPNKKRKSEVAKSVDWAEIDKRIEDDLKYVRWADEERTPHECDDDCIINYKHLRESLDLILTAYHPDIRDEVMGMWCDAVANNADAHLQFSCPKCAVTEEHDPYENMGCGEWCVCERCVADGEE